MSTQNEMQKCAKSAINNAMESVYRHFHESRNLGTTGDISKCEYTSLSLKKAFVTASNLNWIKGEGVGITMTEFYTTNMVPLAHLAPQFPPATHVGVEKLHSLNLWICYRNEDLLASYIPLIPQGSVLSIVTSDSSKTLTGHTLYTCWTNQSWQSQLCMYECTSWLPSFQSIQTYNVLRFKQPFWEFKYIWPGI